MNGVAIAQAEQRQYRSLKDELARIGHLIEDGKRRLETYVFDEAEEKRLLDAIPSLQQDERDLIDRIARLKGAEREAETGAQRKSKEFKKVDDAYRETSQLHVSARNRHQIVKTQVEDLMSSAEKIAASNKEKGRQIIATTDPAIVAANRELAGVRAEIVKAKEEISSMATKRTASKKLSENIAAQMKRWRRLQSESAAAEKILKQKKDQINAVDREIEKKRMTHDEQCMARSAELDLREKDLMEREGTIDRVKGWIKQKGGLLKQAKREIEEFHARSLNHIVIPELDDDF